MGYGFYFKRNYLFNISTPEENEMKMKKNKLDFKEIDQEQKKLLEEIVTLFITEVVEEQAVNYLKKGCIGNEKK